MIDQRLVLTIWSLSGFAVAHTCPLRGTILMNACAGPNLITRLSRWNHHACKSSFNVLFGTVMQERQPIAQAVRRRCPDRQCQEFPVYLPDDL